jgi:hypothetical protein
MAPVGPPSLEPVVVFPFTSVKLVTALVLITLNESNIS